MPTESPAKKIKQALARATTVNERELVWENLGNWLEANERLEPASVAELLRAIRAERADVRTTALVGLLEESFKRSTIPDAHISEPRSLARWLLAPHGRSSKKPRGVLVAINNGRNLDDGCALVRLSRLFDTDHFRTMDLVTIPPAGRAEKRWGETEIWTLQEADVLCFVGRPSMFADCPALDLGNLRFRYRFPDAPPEMRGREVNDESIRIYHHLFSGPPGFETRRAVSHNKGHRNEHAVIQRFQGDGRKTVVFISGTTSLGTVAAAEWLTEVGIGHQADDGALHRLLNESAGAKRVEILIPASAPMPVGERPWTVPHPKAEALIVDGGVNLLTAKIKTVTAILRGPEAKDIVWFRIDGDYVVFDRSLAHQQLLALCWHFHHSGSHFATLQELLDDRAAWPFAAPKRLKDFQNNLQPNIPGLHVHVHSSKGNDSQHPETIEVECDFAVERIP